MIFALNLRRLMKREQVKQKDLVKALDVVQGAVSAWVNGRTPDFPNQQKIARFFKVTVAELFTDPDAVAPGKGGTLAAKGTPYSEGESSEIRELREQFDELITQSPEAIAALKPFLSYLRARKRSPGKG